MNVEITDPLQLSLPNAEGMLESGSAYAVEQDSIEIILSRAHSLLFSLQKDGQYWDFHAHLGLHFISQYLLFNEWFGRTHSRLDRKHLTQLIINSQRDDGSWAQIKNSSANPGEINATIFNYWALKSSGFDPESRIMTKAREYILAQGGIENAALFTKIILALFDNFPWRSIPLTPYILFNDQLPISHRDFSQWTIPHLMAIAYLRKNCVSKNLGEKFDVSELWLKAVKIENAPSKLNILVGRDEPLIKRIVSQQQPKGSWGGYTLSTILSMMALHDYADKSWRKNKKIERAIAKGFSFVEDLYFTSDSGPISGAYKGALMDGKFWDTILVGSCLLESGINRNKLLPVAEYLLKTQQENGGFPYGEDFQYAPDVDDTAEAVLFLHHYRDRYRDELARAISWLCSMQNSDGGWGAFDRDNEGKPLLKILTQDFQDSVDLFDDSSADLTGHILEALGTSGLNVINSEVIRHGVAYLKRTQAENGAWIGRWGVNYLYGTSCAISGLVKAGENFEEPYVQKSLNWLASKQNADGGFGESIDSYLDEKKAGLGLSTPSQTAWALLALCQGGHGLTAHAARAVKYLMDEFSREGQWVDQSVVGTGHPGILYMNYPSYQHVFPVMALSSYLNCLAAQQHDHPRERNIFRS